MSDSDFNKALADRARKMVSEQSHAHGQVVELTEENFDETVGGKKATLVDFWAVWCGPCRTMEPVIERLAGKLGASVNFGKLNVDEHPSIATKFEVQSIPTFMLFKNGRPVDAVIGTMQEAALEMRVRKAAGV